MQAVAVNHLSGHFKSIVVQTKTLLQAYCRKKIVEPLLSAAEQPEEETNQYADYCNNNEKFDEGETLCLVCEQQFRILRT